LSIAHPLDYVQQMSAARNLIVGLLAVGGLTACDHSSHKSAGHPPRPYTIAQIRHAFTAAGITPAPGDVVSVVWGPGVRAMFDAGHGIVVAVYKTAPLSEQDQIGWTNYQAPAMKVSRNVVVLYPKHTLLLPRIKRALAALGT
jgi:hypothetical protein